MNQNQRQPSRRSHPFNIVLLGLCGSGKSTVGSCLSRLMGLGFIDLDRWIEQRAGRTVGEIFGRDGEERFRELEAQALRDIGGVRNHVIALGGGTGLQPESWEKIASLGTKIWLDIPVTIIAKRLLAGEAGIDLTARPHLRGLGSEESGELASGALTSKLSQLRREREEGYGLADVVVSDGHLTAEQCARKICWMVERGAQPKNA